MGTAATSGPSGICSRGKVPLEKQAAVCYNQVGESQTDDDPVYTHRKKAAPGRGWSSPEGRFLQWRAYCSLLCLSSHLLTQLETMFAATDTMKLTIQSMDPPPPAAGVGGDSRFIIAKCDKNYKL